jgi:hypothetical protein
VTAGGVELLDVERRIALFAQAITGSPYEVRSVATFTGSGAVIPRDGAILDSRALYLPERIASYEGATANTRRYRLLSLHQLGYQGSARSIPYRCRAPALADAATAARSRCAPSRVGL